MILLGLSKTEIFIKCLMLMLEHASAMIEKKLAKKLKVQNNRYSCSIYHFFLLKILCFYSAWNVLF